MIRKAIDTSPPEGSPEVLTFQDHVYRSVGPGIVEHNVYCTVCHEKPAVWNLGGKKHGILDPCWDCQNKGYTTVKLSRFFKWLIGE